MILKCCTACGVEKHINMFGKAPTCVDGHRSYCKACHKVRKDRWRHENKDHHNEKCRKWTAENPEKRAAISRADRSKRAVSGAALESKRKWRKNNPEKARADVSARRRKLRSASPPWVDMASIRAVYEEAVRSGLVVDHIVPLRHEKVCGLHVHWNLQLLSREENLKKSNHFDV